MKCVLLSLNIHSSECATGLPLACIHKRPSFQTSGDTVHNDGFVVKLRPNKRKFESHKSDILVSVARYAGDKTKSCAQRTQTFCFIFPCAPPRSAASERKFRRALFESRSGARRVRPARSSCAAPLACG